MNNNRRFEEAVNALHRQDGPSQGSSVCENENKKKIQNTKYKIQNTKLHTSASKNACSVFLIICHQELTNATDKVGKTKTERERHSKLMDRTVLNILCRYAPNTVGPYTGLLN